MYFIGVLCLLSAALALPPPEQLHTNLPAPSSPPELKSEDASKSIEHVVELDPIPPPPELPPLDTPADAVVVESSDESKKPSESAEKSKEEDKSNEKPAVVEEGAGKETKESASAELKEPNIDQNSEESKKDEKSEEPKESEEKKKDSKSEESKEDKKSEEEDKPVLVHIVTQNPSLSSWFPFEFNWPSFHWPTFKQQYRYSGNNQQKQPIYLVKESDLEYY